MLGLVLPAVVFTLTHNVTPNVKTYEGAQFLKKMVAIMHIRLQRNGREWLMFYLQYWFDYSQSGEERLRRQVDLLNKGIKE